MKFETLTNKKKRVGISIGIISVIAVIGITAFTLTRASYKQTQSVPLIKGSISYNKSDLEIVAIKLQQDNGTYSDATEVPTSGYKLNTDISKSYCKVGSTTEKVDYKYESGSHYVKAATKGSKCYLSFDKFQTASEYLIAKNEMVQENGYRYEGKNPNNYVTFNNEVWRIIGVFDVENADTNKTESLVKIIRNESIGNIAYKYDNGTSGWPTSDAYNILNGQYYRGENIYYSYTDLDNNGKYLQMSGKNINDAARKMIQRVKYNIVSDSYKSASEVYTLEKNGAKLSSYIGLMYPSDYGYAVDSASCPRSTTTNNYKSSTCSSNNWLYSAQGEWMMNECGNGACYILANGGIDWADMDWTYIMRPVVYLKSSVSILNNGKDGSQAKPYDLVLN